ncbi:hypothetical protein [Cytobacillus gottheilii]|uniref:hypothetical protein n=1 Tax=Cytobacillus gottheilii TaxID=859144 RepID=UPI000833F87C|nr:hypothetical protein [Cytobacillus gottheilii]
MEKLFFSTEDTRVIHLSEVDNRLKKLINKIGTIDIPLSQNYYSSLVKQIIGQQLSLKAALTITKRVENVWPNFDPLLIDTIDENELRSAGVSGAKVKYIKDLTQKHISRCLWHYKNVRFGI